MPAREHGLQREAIWLHDSAAPLIRYPSVDRPSVDPLRLDEVLVDPYYYAYATANHFRGFSPQACTEPSRSVPATVYIATTRTKPLTEIRGVEYRFVSLEPARFFGFRKRCSEPVEGTKVYTAEVMRCPEPCPERSRRAAEGMAEPEKAVVDSLDKLSYAGGIVEVARVVHAARDRVDLEKLTDYALRMGTHALVQLCPGCQPAGGAHPFDRLRTAWEPRQGTLFYA